MWSLIPRKLPKTKTKQSVARKLRPRFVSLANQMLETLRDQAEKACVCSFFSFQISNSFKPNAGLQTSCRGINRLTSSECGSMTPPRQRPQDRQATSEKPGEVRRPSHPPWEGEDQLSSDRPACAAAWSESTAHAPCGWARAVRHVARQLSQSAQPSAVFKSTAGSTVVGSCVTARESGSEGRLPLPCRALGAEGPVGLVGGMENRDVPPGPYRATKLVRQRERRDWPAG